MLRILGSILCTTIAFCSPITAEQQQPYTIIEDKADLPILSPTFETYQTLKIELKNGLKAYIISDPGAVNSAAALHVQVGSMHCPAEHPGLAHFLEHMLFLGTKEYPIEHEFHEFINNHNGEHNAYTAPDHTAYMFSIDNSAFEECLDRFSSFFREPLFNPSGVTNEINAVNQEFDGTCKSDSWRELHVLRETGNSSHPFAHFACGNKQTLSAVSQETLKNWYHSHYSARLMQLVIYSPLSLEQAVEYVVQKFQDIPSNDYKTPAVEVPFSRKELEGTITYIEPIKDQNVLCLWWELPYDREATELTKPIEMLALPLESEGKDSLIHQLKEEKWAEKISIGKQLLSTSSQMVSLSITLTELGVQQRNQVIEKIFQAIASIKAEGIPQYLYDETKTMLTLQYQYPERKETFDTVRKHIGSLLYEPIESYPLHSEVIQKFDPEAIQEALAQLTPHSCHYLLLSRSTVTGVATDRKEQWMHVPYAIEQIPAETLASWSVVAPDPKIHVPKPNPLIPKNLELLHTASKDAAALTPQLISTNTKGNLYFAPDTYYRVPEIWWRFTIKTPEIDLARPETIVMSDLYQIALEEELNEIKDQAVHACLGCNVSMDHENNSFEIEITGVNDNAGILLQEIQQQMNKLTLEMGKFKLYKERLLKNYQNFTHERPHKHAKELFDNASHKEFVTAAEKARVLKKVSYKAANEYFKNIFKQNYTEALLYGNMTDEQALSVWQNFQALLGGNVYPASERKRPEMVYLPADQGPFFIETKIKQPGYATILAIQNAPFSFKNHAAQQIIQQSLSSPFFDTLRTKQKTGYIVGSKQEEINQLLTIRLITESSGHDCKNLLSRFDLFLESYLQNLQETLTQKNFNDIKQGLIAEMEHPYPSLSTQGEAWHRAIYEYCDIDWLKKHIAALKELSYEECLAKAHEILGQQNRRRLAIFVEGTPPSTPAVYPYAKVRNATALKGSVSEGAIPK
jgi:insulysin